MNVYVNKDNVLLNEANNSPIFIEMNGTRVQATDSASSYKFSYTGILPQQVVDTVEVRLGVIVKNPSIHSYLIALLSNEGTEDLAADLLRYAAAAQVVAKYRTDALATKGLDLTGKGSSFVTVTADEFVPGVRVTAVALRLDNTLALVGDDGTVVPVNASQMDMVKTVGDARCSVATYVKWALNGGITNTDLLNLVRAMYTYGLSARAYVGR